MSSGKTAQAHERHGHRNLSDFGKLANFVGGIGKHRAATDVDDRLFGLQDCFRSLFDLVLIAVHRRIVAAQMDFIRIFEFSLRDAYILGNIDQHRSRPPDWWQCKKPP